MKLNNMQKPLVIFSLVTILILLKYLLSPAVRAQTMSNDYYILQQESIDKNAAEKSTPVKSDIPNTISDVYIGQNYKARSGFEGLPNSPLVLSISQTSIDFGPLSPNNPVLRSNNLSVQANSVYSYSVFASENQPLTSSNNNSIPDTACDNDSCTQNLAASWNSLLTYGFGYRCDNLKGLVCDNEFSDQSFYKQFSDLSKSESEEAVITGLGGKNEKKAQVTYKVNISPSQAQALYSNKVTYILIPGF